MNSHEDIRKALLSENEETRRDALQSLKGIPLAESCALFFQGMADPSWRVRKEAVDLFLAADPNEGSITDLLELLRNEDNAGLRNSAVEALTKLGVRATSSLIRMAQDADADVRKFVVDVMGAIGNPIFLPNLLEALDDPEINVAAAAAEHLGNVGDSEAVPRLIDSIIASDSLFFRFSALAALGKLSSHAPVPSEIIALADQDFLRTGVFECLGSIGDESAFPVLLKGFESRQKSSRKTSIVSFFRLFRKVGASARQAAEKTLRELKGTPTVTALIESFDVEDPSVSEAIILLLGIIGDGRGASTLLAGCSNERLSEAAFGALKQFGEEGIAAIVALYPAADELSRCAICSVIDQLAFRGGIPLIHSALADPSSRVRRIAVSAAGRLGLTECIPTIVSLLENSDPQLRSAAVSCLQVLALIDRNAIKDIAYHLGTSDQPEQRRNAAMLHATLGDGDSLLLLLKDEDAGVRQAAVASIGKLHLSSSSGLLLIALVDEDPDVRLAAAEALGESNRSELVDALLPALNDEDSWVQSAVLKSIAKLDAQRVVPVIRGIYDRADGLLMITCLELLEQVAGDESISLVEAALANDDDDVSRLAVSVLARQGEAWLEGNAERLLAHPRANIRALWVGVISASLKPQVANPLLRNALSNEKSELVRERILQMLETLA